MIEYEIRKLSLYKEWDKLKEHINNKIKNMDDYDQNEYLGEILLFGLDYGLDPVIEIYSSHDQIDLDIEKNWYREWLNHPSRLLIEDRDLDYLNYRIYKLLKKSRSSNMFLNDIYRLLHMSYDVISIGD